MVAKAKPKVKTAKTWPFPTPGVSKEKVSSKTKPSTAPSIRSGSTVKAKASVKKPTPAKAGGIAADSKKHVVMATLNNVELAKARSALSLDLYADGKKIGNLEVGQGSFFWTGARRKKSKPIDWTKFAAKMNDWAYEK